MPKKIQGPPKSYLHSRRPNLQDALILEDKTTFDRAINALTRKGYFTPQPRPWKLGFKERGLGRQDFCVLDNFGDLVAEMPNKITAEFIIEAVNNIKENNVVKSTKLNTSLTIGQLFSVENISRFAEKHLATRVYKAIRNTKVWEMDDSLTEISLRKLQRIDNCGKVSIDIIRKILDLEGVKLK